MINIKRLLSRGDGAGCSDVCCFCPMHRSPLQAVLQEEDEQEWLDYEETETAITMDIADSILQDLIADTVREMTEMHAHETSSLHIQRWTTFPVDVHHLILLRNLVLRLCHSCCQDPPRKKSCSRKRSCSAAQIRWDRLQCTACSLSSFLRTSIRFCKLNAQ